MSRLVHVWWSSYRRRWLAECMVPSCGWSAGNMARTTVEAAAVEHAAAEHPSLVLNEPES